MEEDQKEPRELLLQPQAPLGVDSNNREMSQTLNFPRAAARLASLGLLIC